MLLVTPPTDVAAVETPRLPESRESVIGKRSPTKKDAGLPSCARNKTWRPLCTSVSASENCAAMAGSVKRNVVLPPPTTVSGGIRELRFRELPALPELDPFPKMLASRVTKVLMSLACRNWDMRLGVREINSAEEGGSRPRVRAL